MDLYGTGDTLDEIRKKIEEYGLEKQLILKGNVKDVYQVYGDYAFLILHLMGGASTCTLRGKSVGTSDDKF